ncbi:MAG: ABC transporter permease [Propionibacteriaceae bacterium]|jgi:ribose transport system permease protein|nr:ABC transporter permease [Propionibacteriaceae bacterium]
MSSTLERFEDMPVIGSIIKYFNDNLGILIGLTGMLVFLSIFAENFLTVSNGLNVLRAISTNGLLAIGVMLSIMLAGIDLTGGALLAVSGVVTVMCMQSFGLNMWVSIMLGLVVGMAAGSANGAIIAFTGIHPFVVTLAMQSICRGSAYLLADGKPVPLETADKEAYSLIGNGDLFGVPLPAIYVLVAFLGLYVFLNKTRTGRHIYAVGGNPKAARFSGISTTKVKILVWSISGVLAAFAGIVLSARMTSGQPTQGVAYETDAIAAVVLGGTSFFGGVGRVGGVFIGVLIIGLISNGLTLMHVNSFWQYVVKGVIILVAVYFDMQKNKGSVRTEV